MSNLIINPGSANKGGTKEQAQKNAERWLKLIHDEGFREVEMTGGELDSYGNYEFKFTHSVTKKVAILAIHGFTKKECEAFTFRPREYWNGCSTSNPKIEDWLEDGFDYRIEYYRIGKITPDKV